MRTNAAILSLALVACGGGEDELTCAEVNLTGTFELSPCGILFDRDGVLHYEWSEGGVLMPDGTRYGSEWPEEGGECHAIECEGPATDINRFCEYATGDGFSGVNPESGDAYDDCVVLPTTTTLVGNNATNGSRLGYCTPVGDEWALLPCV